ncbi:MAG: hypothetical protein AAGJ34_08710 [Pseudomonadota bacterium]
MPTVSLALSIERRDSNTFDAIARPSGLFSNQELRYQVAAEQPVDDPCSGDWSALSFIIAAMERGYDLHVDGPMSGRLLHYLNSDFQAVIRKYEPKLNHISVSAADVVTLKPRKTERRATAFSGGVDSFTTLELYSKDSIQPLTDLTYFNIGTFGFVDVPETFRLFEEGYDRVKEMAKSKGYGAISVQANTNMFHTHLTNFLKTHTIRNAAAAMVLDGTIDEYLYSGAYDYKETKVAPHYEITPLDPVILPLVGNDVIRFYPAGLSYSRFEKTRLIANAEETYDKLDVCITTSQYRIKNKKLNCSQCEKCLRTMLTLEAIGKLDKYAPVFDIELFHRKKKRGLRTLWENAVKGQPIEIDLFAHLDPKLYRVPTRFEMMVEKVGKRVTRVLRKLGFPTYGTRIPTQKQAK